MEDERLNQGLDGEPEKENVEPPKHSAKEKLEKEMQDAKNKGFAEPVISYLLRRCKEDEGFAQDVMQTHKTWEKCYAYIQGQARKQAKDGCAAIRDEVVYEWAEDYYRLDDKAEEERKARERAESKKKAEENKKKASAKPVPKQEPKKEPKKEAPKHGKNEMDGQMDLFSMMGL